MARPAITLKALIDRFQLSQDLLDMEVSEEHLRETSRIIADHGIVGPELGLTSQEMTAISSNVRTQELQKMEMLSKWKQKNAWMATYQKLIEALLKCSRADHAQDVCKLLTESVPPDSLPTSPQSISDASGTDDAAPLEEVQTKIREFERRFKALKKSTREALESHNTDVKVVVECLTDLPADDMPEHMVFLKENMDDLLHAESLLKLFLLMNLYWNYLAYHLLEHLIKEFSVEEVKGKMEKYKNDLKQFLWDTPLDAFCKTQKRSVKPPEGFRELVVKLPWRGSVKLGVVEEFRQQYAYHHNLREFSMMLIAILPGSFTVVWCIPESIVTQLMKEVVEDVLSMYAVTSLEIAGVCVYKQSSTLSGSVIDGPPVEDAARYTAVSASDVVVTQKEQAAEASLSTSAMKEASTDKTALSLAKAPTGKNSPPTSTIAQAGAQKPSAGRAQDQGYECEFVVPPSSTFQTECPVCLRILRNPHEATCCGTAFCHNCISQVRERCPTCRVEEYTIYHSKGLERSLKQQYVRCENHEHGCGWTGELGQYDSHLNLNSTLQERMGGCLHANIECHNGCGEAIPRSHILLHEMEECHKRDDHTELEKSLYIYIQKLTRDIVQKDERIAELENENAQLKKEMHSVTSAPDESATQDVIHETSRIEKQTREPEGELATAREEMLPITPAIAESATIIPVQRTIHNFTELQRFHKEYVSEPFYTHEEGYKMCLWVFPHGCGDAKDTHVSLFTAFMKGENDKKLKWPFRGTLTVRLVDQVHNRYHQDSVICYDDKASSYARRLTVGEKSQGWGVWELTSHEYLRDTNCQFLKDDCLKIQVIKVEFDTAKRKGFFRW